MEDDDDDDDDFVRVNMQLHRIYRKEKLIRKISNYIEKI